MTYCVKVTYLADWGEDCPVTQYFDVDDTLRATRTIEIYRNGAIGWTDLAQNIEMGGAYFIGSSMPTLAQTQAPDLAQTEEFRSDIITQSEFENAWRIALQNTPVL